MKNNSSLESKTKEELIEEIEGLKNEIDKKNLAINILKLTVEILSEEK